MLMADVAAAGNALEIDEATTRAASRAYEIFLARGEQPGHHEDDWLQAERELRLGQS